MIREIEIFVLLILARFCSATQISPPFQKQDFQFTTTLQCFFDNRDVFNYRIQFKEMDHLLWWDDHITELAKDQSPVGSTNFVIQGFSESNEPIEPFTEIWHDCTFDRKEMRLLVRIRPKCDVAMGKPCHYNSIIDLTESWGEQNGTMEFKYDLLPFDKK